MAEQPEGAYDTLTAQLTAAMLRFDIERLPQNREVIPGLGGRLGEVAFIFVPRKDLVPDAELVQYLQRLAKPVIVGALAHKGLVATWWPAGLDERGLNVWDHDLRNQQGWIAKFLKDLALADDEAVLLETTGETLIFPAGALRRWGDTYGVHVGWTLTDSRGDPRARARLNLIRGDGGRTPGDSCGLPARPA